MYLPWNAYNSYSGETRVATGDLDGDGLDELVVGIGYYPYSGGWAAVLRLPAVRSDEEWALALLERDVVVHPGHFYDFAASDRLVLSLIPEPAVFGEALARIEALAGESG